MKHNPLCLSFSFASAAQSTLVAESSKAIVQQQLNDYNARDLEAFLTTYSDSITLYEFPNQLMVRGKAEMRRPLWCSI